MPNPSRVLSLILATLFYLLLSGCAGTVKHMESVPVERVVDIPGEGKAMVVFMRPSGFGFAIQSSVFEVRDNQASLVGIVAAKKKVAYEVDPGSHLFMVIGESADFMSAELEADKTYYARVTPRMGVWKARFSLAPVDAAERDSGDLDEWLDECAWVEKTPASENWARGNMASIQSKQYEYYQKWISKDPADKPQLLPQDGR